MSACIAPQFSFKSSCSRNLCDRAHRSHLLAVQTASGKPCCCITLFFSTCVSLSSVLKDAFRGRLALYILSRLVRGRVRRWRLLSRRARRRRGVVRARSRLPELRRRARPGPLLRAGPAAAGEAPDSRKVQGQRGGAGPGRVGGTRRGIWWRKQS